MIRRIDARAGNVRIGSEVPVAIEQRRFLDELDLAVPLPPTGADRLSRNLENRTDRCCKTGYRRE
jgi:hypothetical protein